MTGKDIRQRIELTGTTYSDLASRLGISPQALNSKLNGKDLKLSFVQMVADAINKPIYYLFKDDSLSDQVQESQAVYQEQVRRDDLTKRIAELERRIRDKDEIILAQKKLIEMYERQSKARVYK